MPVVVTARPNDDEDMEDVGRYYIMQFGVRAAGYFGLEQITIAADDESQSIGSADLRRVRLGALAGLALRFLSIQNVDWESGQSNEANFFELDSNDFEEAHLAGGATAQDAKLLPRFVEVDGEITTPPEWRAELRKLGPSSPKVAQTVAAVYRRSERYGEPPNKGVEQLLGLAPSTASHWIKLARQAGALAPAKRKARAESRAHGNH